MRAYSHFLMTAVLNDGLKTRGLPVHTRALLLGSVMPDAPLLLLSLGFIARRSWSGVPPADDPICGSRFNNLYFHNPFWQAGHALFHTPFLIGLMTLVGYAGLRRQKRWGLGPFWFSIGCGFHSLIDIFTHKNDGPLLFFPFNWRYRFPGVISYWDSRYGGKTFALVERLLDLALLSYLAVIWFLRRRSEREKR